MSWSISNGVFNPTNQARRKVAKPPVLFTGAAHGTPATRHLLTLGLSRSGTSSGRKRSRRASSGTSSSSGTARKRRSSSRKTSASGAKRSRSGSSAHLVKGSQAAKTHMAKLRSMVGKKKAA